MNKTQVLAANIFSEVAQAEKKSKIQEMKLGVMIITVFFRKKEFGDCSDKVFTNLAISIRVYD